MRTRFVMVLMLLAALACRIDISTSYIKEAHITRDPEGTERIGRGYAYGSEDTFHAVIELAQAKGPEEIRIVWSVKEAAGLEPGTVLGEETVEIENGVILFHLAPEHEWALGKYQFDIYLNGDHEKTVEFRVR